MSAFKHIFTNDMIVILNGGGEMNISICIDALYNGKDFNESMKRIAD